MPIGALSAKELMEHGTRGTNEQRAGSRAARGAGAALLCPAHHSPRPKLCAASVCLHQRLAAALGGTSEAPPA